MVMSLSLYDARVWAADRFRFFEHPIPRRVTVIDHTPKRRLHWEDYGLIVVYCFVCLIVGVPVLMIGCFGVYTILTNL